MKNSDMELFVERVPKVLNLSCLEIAFIIDSSLTAHYGY